MVRRRLDVIDSTARCRFWRLKKMPIKARSQILKNEASKKGNYASIVCWILVCVAHEADDIFASYSIYKTVEGRSIFLSSPLIAYTRLLKDGQSFFLHHRVLFYDILYFSSVHLNESGYHLVMICVYPPPTRILLIRVERPLVNYICYLWLRKATDY